MENKFCSGCGSKLEEGQLFCSNCGKKLDLNQAKNKDNDVDTKKEIKMENSSSKLKETKKCRISVVDIIRYVFGGLFCFSGISNIASGEWIGVTFILIGISLFPFIYKKYVCKIIPKNKSLKLLQILLPICLIIFSISVTPVNDMDDVDDENKGFKKQDDKKVTVEVADFSSMSESEVLTWCKGKNLNCNFQQEYSETVAKGGYIKQSVDATRKVAEGSKIMIIYSLGKEPTTEQKNALRKAESYAKIMHMSKQGIYDQLTSEYGENFAKEDAQYAIDNTDWNWNANALLKAKTYRDTMSMSKNRIYDQLTSQYGEKFTKEEAQYAIDHLDD